MRSSRTSFRSTSTTTCSTFCRRRSQYEAFAYQKHQAQDGSSNRLRFRMQNDWLDRLTGDNGRFGTLFVRRLVRSHSSRPSTRRCESGLAFRFKVPESEVIRSVGYALPELFRELASYRIKPHPDTRPQGRDDANQFAVRCVAAPSGHRVLQTEPESAACAREPRGFEIVKCTPYVPNSAYLLFRPEQRLVEELARAFDAALPMWRAKLDSEHLVSERRGRQPRHQHAGPQGGLTPIRAQFRCMRSGESAGHYAMTHPQRIIDACGRRLDHSWISFCRRLYRQSLYIVCLHGLRPARLLSRRPVRTYQRQQIFASYAEFKSQLQSIVDIADADAARQPAQRLLDHASKRRPGALRPRQPVRVPLPRQRHERRLRRRLQQLEPLGELGTRPRTSPARTSGFAKARCRPTPAPTTKSSSTTTGFSTRRTRCKCGAAWARPTTSSACRAMSSRRKPSATPATPRGTLTADTTVNSTNMGYGINYRVYTPAATPPMSCANLPVVYVTDGHEYLADHLGSMPIVLDNLIAAGRLRPTIAVFIDPASPATRATIAGISEYNMNPNFANFVAGELVPAIDATYRTDATAEGRTILGTSMGGLNAAYFGAVKGNVFQNIAPQSPAYNQNSGHLFALSEQRPAASSTSSKPTARSAAMAPAPTRWQTSGPPAATTSRRSSSNEGHSWGQWRGQLDDILIDAHRPAADRRLQPGRHRRYGGLRCVA